jgi:beta-D-xylosidase 4
LQYVLTHLQDRDDITWPTTQLSLINQLSNLTKPLIVVQLGTMVDSASLLPKTGVNSLVWAGYPGQDGGTAIFNILTGQTAPAGRLPVTQYPVCPLFGYMNNRS